MKKVTANLLKATCVAIGAKEKGNQLPLAIGGTGFFVDPEGFVLTANHVLENLLETTIPLNKEGREVDFGAFWFVPIDTESVQLQSRKITNFRTLDLAVHSEKYLGQKDVDVALGRIEGEYGNLPYLKFKKSGKLELYDDVLICGYPGGRFSLNVQRLEIGFKTSPIIQKGMISGLMPADMTKNPVGIQTDIIATAGTSGSPIVKEDDGEVIGICQKVIPSPVISKEGLIGSALIGPVWGISNYLMYPTIKKTLEIVKPQFENDGLLKPEFKDKRNQVFKGKIKDGKFLD